jgi:hypothetical protein
VDRVTAVELVESLSARGVAICVADGRIGVQPAGRLNDQERALIRAHKSELLALYASTASGPPTVRAIAALRPAPCRMRGCPEHAVPSALPDGTRPLERYPRDWRDPLALRACSCGSRRFWLSPHGAIKCCACNPPADLNLAEAWVLAREPDGSIPGDILSLLHIVSPIQ